MSDCINKNSVLNRVPYDNYKIYHPNGTLMCFSSLKKIKWYLSRNLAKYIDNTSIMLLFTPNGFGDPLDILESRKNYCVITKKETDLTRHHVIPAQYRKHFRMCYKDKNSTDIMLLNRIVHNEYEITATKFKDQLEKDYINYIIDERIVALNNARAKYNILKHHYNFIPPEKQVYIKMSYDGLCEKYGFVESDFIKQKDNTNYNKIIVDKIKEENLIILWRLHFLKYGQPKYLPTWWKPNLIKIVNNNKNSKMELTTIDMTNPITLTLIKKYDLYDIASLYI